MILYMYIALGPGLTTPWGWNFNDLYMYIAPGQGQTSPRGQSFDVNSLVTSFICCKFQKNVFEVWFYTIFYMIEYMYIATGQR